MVPIEGNTKSVFNIVPKYLTSLFQCPFDKINWPAADELLIFGYVYHSVRLTTVFRTLVTTGTLTNITLDK